MNPTLSPIIDTERAGQQAGGNRDLAKELFSLLREELMRSLSELPQTETGDDRRRAGEIAHKLRSSARYCAAPHLEQAAERLEKEARTGSGALLELKQALRQAIQEILDLKDPYVS